MTGDPFLDGLHEKLKADNYDKKYKELSSKIRMDLILVNPDALQKICESINTPDLLDILEWEESEIKFVVSILQKRLESKYNEFLSGLESIPKSPEPIMGITTQVIAQLNKEIIMKNKDFLKEIK